MVLMAMYVALAVALDIFKESIAFLDMPQGGSVNIALIPVVLAAFHLGPLWGMATGAIWMLVSFIIIPPTLASGYALLGFLLDYVVPSIIIGGASFIFIKKSNLWTMEAGIVITMLIRMLSLVISGAFAWPGDYAAGSLAAWIASAQYNLPYSIATMVMLMVVTPLLYRLFAKEMKKPI